MKNKTIPYALAGTMIVLVACIIWKKSKKNHMRDRDLFYLRNQSHGDYYGEYTL